MKSLVTRVTIDSPMRNWTMQRKAMNISFRYFPRLMEGNVSTTAVLSASTPTNYGTQMDKLWVVTDFRQSRGVSGKGEEYLAVQTKQNNHEEKQNGP